MKQDQIDLRHEKRHVDLACRQGMNQDQIDLRHEKRHVDLACRQGMNQDQIVCLQEERYGDLAYRQSAAPRWDEAQGWRLEGVVKDPSLAWLQQQLLPRQQPGHE